MTSNPRISRTALLVGALVAATVGPPSCAQPIAPKVAALNSLIENPGFEDGDQLPAFWARFPKQDEEWGRNLRDTRVRHSGNASGLLASAATHLPGGAGVQWNRYNISVEGGSTLIASFYVKTDATTAAGAGIHSYDGDGKHLGFARIEVPRTSEEWAYVRAEVPLPKAAVKIGYALYGTDKTNTWFDDVALIGTPQTAAIRATPTVDGKLDDDCWRDGTVIDQFVLHTGEGFPTESPQAWIAYDDDHLYVAFRCPHAPGASLKREAAEHDGDTWLDDSVEIFLDPWHQHEQYYQWCVNCAGVIRDTRGTDTQWESGARAEIHRGEAEWTVELAIPFKSLALTLDTGEVWGINLVRNDRARGETSTWSLGGFHKPGRFGNVSLKPELGDVLRSDLTKRLDAQKQRRNSLLAELRRGKLTPAEMKEPSAILDRSQETLDRLRAIAEGGPLPATGWDGVRTALAKAAKAVGEARNAAIANLYKVGDSDGIDGFRVAIAHSLQKIRRDGDVVEGVIARRVKLTAARDETESFQLVVMPNGSRLSGVTVEAGPLKGAVGKIPVEWKRVGYVETAPPGYPTEYVGWWPDPLYPAGPLDIAADQRQPLWFTVSVPPEATPGKYAGEVSIRHGRDEVSVPVELRVRSFRLPRPGTLATAFGLYANVLTRWYYGDTPYSEAITPEQYHTWCEFLGRYRLAPKNFAREFVTTARNDEGSLSVNMDALQKLVTPLAPKYFAPYSFCMYRTPVGNAIGTGEGRTSANDPDVAAATVKAYADEWKRQGFPKEVYLYGYDEPRPEHYDFLRETYAKIKEVAPDFPLLQTIGDPSPEELVGLVDIWCPLTSRLDTPFYTSRRKAGDTLWTYTCCSPKHPYANFFVDRPATEHRVLFWQTRQYGATGFLYWCVCYWPGPPNAASGEPCFPDVPLHWKDIGTYKTFKDNGDGWLLYPGPNFTPWPSIRLEVIRDGIEDYEYLALLSRLIAEAKAMPRAQRPAAEVLAQAEELATVPEEISHEMREYTTDPQSIFARRAAVGDMIERLNDREQEEAGKGPGGANLLPGPLGG